MEKLVKLGIKKEAGWIYFIDRIGDVSRVKIGSNDYQKVAKCGVRRNTGYVYILDQQGDVSRIETSEPIPATDKEQVEYVKALEENDERILIRIEERERLRKERMRSEVRKKLFEEEFKDLIKDGREPIPEEVRHEVWRRDGGKCVKCGNRENLEFDHIIPLAKGGSNTVRNIELLCEKCNRSKGDKIE